MSDYVFTDPTPDDLERLGTDTAPPIDAPEYPCSVCGREAGPYSGRGRKPTKCPEHKGATSAGRPKTTGKNSVIAGQAADTLAQYNDLVAFIAIMAKYEGTGEAIQNANDVFREKAYAALLTDPDLAASIIKSGGISGKAALIISYAMLAGAVAPVAMMEARVHKQERLERLEALENQ